MARKYPPSRSAWRERAISSIETATIAPSTRPASARSIRIILGLPATETAESSAASATSRTAFERRSRCEKTIAATAELTPIKSVSTVAISPSSARSKRLSACMLHTGWGSRPGSAGPRNQSTGRGAVPAPEGFPTSQSGFGTGREPAVEPLSAMFHSFVEPFPQGWRGLLPNPSAHGGTTVSRSDDSIRSSQ